ncbi:MAG: DUF5688 family protein [Lachnospiraceae bacterium]|nr:DUF5688 family protein [Lachnospiraceae bacterium]
MNLKEFRNVLIDYINSNYEDREAVENDAIKNNGLKLTGIVIKRPNVLVSPSIYLENYYGRYISGESISEIANELIDLADGNQFEGELCQDDFLDFNKVKDNVRIKLINTKQNEELLKSIPHRAFLDLSEVVYCDVSNIMGMSATMVVKNEYMEKWGISADNLIDIAYENTKRNGVTIEDITNIIGRFSPEVDSGDTFELADSRGKMHVMTLGKSFFGAISMTYDDVLDDFVKNECRGVYIIPSSIHEVILLKDNGQIEANTLNMMINCVNKENLGIEEILSSHAYYYSSDDGYSIV